jgi:hypothetical protein
MVREMQRGVDFFEAFAHAMRGTQLDVAMDRTESLDLRIKLFRNYIDLLRTGSRGVPVMVLRGGPAAPPRPVTPAPVTPVPPPQPQAPAPTPTPQPEAPPQP